MRPGALRVGHCRGPSWPDFAVVFAGLAFAVLAVAALAHVAAPTSWRSLGQRQLPDRASLVVGIFVNNVVVAATPLLGGWVAAGQRERGHRLTACSLVAVPAVVVARSVGVIGLVGGLDPEWLADAAPWWSLEIAALGVSSCTGWWVLRHPDRRQTDGAAAVRRASVAALGFLAVGALVEVFSA